MSAYLQEVDDTHQPSLPPLRAAPAARRPGTLAGSSSSRAYLTGNTRPRGVTVEPIPPPAARSFAHSPLAAGASVPSAMHSPRFLHSSGPVHELELSLCDQRMVSEGDESGGGTGVNRNLLLDLEDEGGEYLPEGDGGDDDSSGGDDAMETGMPDQPATGSAMDDSDSGCEDYNSPVKKKSRAGAARSGKVSKRAAAKAAGGAPLKPQASDGPETAQLLDLLGGNAPSVPMGFGGLGGQGAGAQHVGWEAAAAARTAAATTTNASLKGRKAAAHKAAAVPKAAKGTKGVAKKPMKTVEEVAGGKGQAAKAAKVKLAEQSLGSLSISGMGDSSSSSSTFVQQGGGPPRGLRQSQLSGSGLSDQHTEMVRQGQVANTHKLQQQSAAAESIKQRVKATNDLVQAQQLPAKRASEQVHGNSAGQAGGQGSSAMETGSVVQQAQAAGGGTCGALKDRFWQLFAAMSQEERKAATQIPDGERKAYLEKLLAGPL